MKLLVSLAVLILFSAEVHTKCDYNIVAPRVAKLGENFYFNVVYYCSNETEQNSTFALEASIIAWNRWRRSNRDDSQNVELASKQFVVKAGDFRRYALEVPKVRHQKSHINFTVEAKGAENFVSKSILAVNSKQVSIYIQTDKHYYKPGQTVHYRLLAFDAYLKPYTRPFNITIHDERGNLIVQRLNEQSEFGVISGSVDLSPFTLLGRWSIKALCEDDSHMTSFSVSEYVLPKYKVELHTPNFYLLVPKEREENTGPKDSDIYEDLKFSISAKYTFGKPLKGFANVHVTLDTRYGRHGSAQLVPSITKILRLESGKAEVSLKYSDLLGLIPCKETYETLDYRSVRIKVEVLEDETGKKLSADKLLSVKSTKYSLEYLDDSTYFKPGFKTRKFLRLKHVNLDSPLIEDIRYANGTMKGIAVKVNYYMANASSAIVNYSLVRLSKKGIAVVELIVHPTIDRIEIEASFYDSSTQKSVHAYYTRLTAIRTRDQQFLDVQLKKNKGFLKPNQETVFTVNASEPIETFYYQFFGKNMLLLSEAVHSNSSKYHEFSVLITEKMGLQLAPTAQVFVFFISSRGELIADSLKLEVDDYFANKVDLSFNATTVLPGSKVALTVKSPENSYLGYFAIDKSVLLMGSYEQFSQQKVENELAGYVKKRFYSYSRKKRSVETDPESDPLDCYINEKFLWPVHTLARSTSELIDNSGVLIITNSHIHEAPYYYDYSYSYADADDDIQEFHTENARMGAPMASVSTTTRKIANGPSGSARPPKVRKNFPETWFWVDMIKSTPEDHSQVLTAPDTITEWVVSAFSTHKDKGIGVAEPTHITVFQPLFLSLNLPASIIRGEELALTISVFNYLSEDINATITLKKSEHYKVKSCSSENINNLIGDDIVRVLEIKANEAASFHVWFVATSIGQVPIEVEAISEHGGDAISKKLLVKPEGEEQTKTKISFIKPNASTPFITNFTTELPPSDIYVPDSAIFQLTSIGDILAPVTSNIGNLVSVPKGCGEQNIVNFAPSIYSLSYLKSANISNPELTSKLFSHLHSGYQRQLTFKRDDYTYSAFGQDDAVGSVWLTSFVLKSLLDAKEHIEVELEDIEKGLKNILLTQDIDGQFRDYLNARIIHSKMQGGSAKAMTPYVLITLLKSQKYFNHPELHYWLDEAITEATKYLEDNLETYKQDVYSLSIVAYALHLAKSDRINEILEKLDQLAIHEDGKTYWKDTAKEATEEEQQDPIWIAFGSLPPTHEVEMTAYNLLTRVELGQLDKALPIAQWLIENGNGRGGFVSTQDTVIGLEAISKFAALISDTNNPEIDVEVSYNSENGLKHEYFDTITKVNGLVLQTIDLPKNTTSVSVKAEGEGFSMIQLLTRFNVFVEQPSTDIHLDIDRTIQDQQINITLNTWWTSKSESGMVVIEVKLLTGYVLHDIDMLRLQLRGIVNKVELIDDVVNFYIEELTETKTKVSFLLDKELAVHGIKPASIQVYSYYQPKTRNIKYYTAESGTTWVSACPKCCE